MLYPHSARLKAYVSALLVTLALTGCTGVQIHRATMHHTVSLTPEKLVSNCMAFLTPSTPTGQEEDKQALVLGFVDVIHELREGVCVVPLSETLGAINENNLSEDYLEMYHDYKETGLFRADLLKKISDITHARYLVQLNLSGFKQESLGRFSFLGWRLVDTKIGNIRIFVQVWDGHTGTIAWEGSQELNYADDTFKEKPVTFRLVVRQAAEELVNRLPHVAKQQKPEQQVEPAKQTVEVDDD
jgi:hypothetical protein